MEAVGAVKVVEVLDFNDGLVSLQIICPWSPYLEDLLSKRLFSLVF